jgi:hypothetical protein
MQSRRLDKVHMLMLGEQIMDEELGQGSNIKASSRDLCDTSMLVNPIVRLQ